MFSEAPELYDAIYGTFKDYDGEAEQVARVLQEVAPGARRLLDVGCGTGEHAVRLRSRYGYDVGGLDIEPGFVELARAKLPSADFWLGDMAAFDLGVRFDAIVCLFSSIGYLADLSAVERAAGCFLQHLSPGGVALVEPWFSPEAWTAGRIYVHTGETATGHIVRMSHSRVEGRVSKLEFHYLIGTGEGIEHRIEHHELGLFTTAELVQAFENAGFASVRHDPEGLTGRGLLIAKKPAGAA
jgi:SAM-dependent methyltransferase